MKSKMLAKIDKVNATLRVDAWSNYQACLRKVFLAYPPEFFSGPLYLLDKGDYDGVLRWADGIASIEYMTPGQHRLYHQMAALIRKYPFPEGTVTTDPEGKAIKSFLASEHKCKRVNQRFAAYKNVRSPSEAVLKRARSYIAYVLGEFNLSEIWDECAFGAGASLGVHGNATNLARKLTCESWTVTPGAYYYARAALKSDIHVFELLNSMPNVENYFSVDPDLFNCRFGEKATLVGHNKIAFVPKDAMTLRSIAVEPLLNGYLQKGADVVMRKRLKRVGIDLSDQSRNQEWARIGSIQGDDPGALATIDLSSASDSISIGLCEALLPPDWYQFLDAIRSHSYELNGKVFPYHKFTSMGNGFCFPLESLIFASLCHASQDVSVPMTEFLVYGDDIVVEGHVFPLLLKTLAMAGFKVNPKKTFNKGDFRESCGADWFEGEDVRPIILDYALDSLENVIKFHNALKSKGVISDILSEVREFLLELIPPNVRLVRPYKGNPDTAFEVDFDVFMASRFSRWHRETFCWTWVEIVKKAKPDIAVKSHVGYSVALIAGAVRGAKASCPFSERFTACTNVRRMGHSGSTSIYLPVNNGVEGDSGANGWLYLTTPSSKMKGVEATT